MDAEIKKALDLANWSEDRGFTSVNAPICPHCESKLDPNTLASKGTALCVRCRKRFHWRMVRTPLGMGWMTWVRVREQAKDAQAPPVSDR